VARLFDRSASQLPNQKLAISSPISNHHPILNFIELSWIIGQELPNRRLAP